LLWYLPWQRQLGCACDPDLNHARIDDLEPRLTRSGYDVRSLAEQFDAKPAEIRRLLRGDLDPARSRELMNEMRAARLPT
jgi:hypothetical protein